MLFNRDELDSDEEWYFTWYMEELLNAGIIIKYKYHPGSKELSPQRNFKMEKVLKTKTNIIERELIAAHEYTPDFVLHWNNQFRHIFFDEMFTIFKDANAPFIATVGNNNLCYTPVEIKAAFDRNNMTRAFRINQKWILDKFNIYVDEIVPEKLFKKTFTPRRYLGTDKTNKPRKIDFTTKTLEEYICQRKKELSIL